MIELILSNITPIATAVVAFLTCVGGGYAFLVREKRNFRNEITEASVSLVEREQKYSKLLETRLDLKDKDLQRISQELIELRIAQAGSGVDPEEILKDIIKSDSLGLMWANRRDSETTYTMVGVSKMYAATFLGGPQELYEGRTDYEVFNEAHARAFIKNNEQIYKDQTGMRVEEPARSKYTGVTGI